VITSSIALFVYSARRCLTLIQRSSFQYCATFQALSIGDGESASAIMIRSHCILFLIDSLRSECIPRGSGVKRRERGDG